MIEINKKVFFTGLAFLSTLARVNLLNCVSMNNQEYKVRPQIVNLNMDEPVFFRFSIKTSKYSGMTQFEHENIVLIMLKIWMLKYLI